MAAADHRRPEKAIMRDFGSGKVWGISEGKELPEVNGSSGGGPPLCTSARCFQSVDSGSPSCPEVDELDKCRIKI